MTVGIIVVGATLLAVAVICLVAIVVSTSGGSRWGESVWKAADGPNGPDKQDPPPPKS